jgi:tetratricopeptide (TPR) repeat protein
VRPLEQKIREILQEFCALNVRRYTENLEAYACYLQGRYHLDERIQVHLKKSVHCFRAAILRDQKYALAYAGLADAYATFGNYRRAKSAALKAIEIDDTLAAAHTSIGFIRMFYDRDWAGSEEAFKRALELDPLYPTAHHWYALYLEHALRFHEAIHEIRRAHELDPLSLIISAAVARVYMHAGQVDNALRQCNRAIDLDPDFYPTYGVLAWIYRKKHMFKEALSAAQKAFEVSHGDTEMLADLAIAYALAGHRKDAEEILRGVRQPVPKKKRMPPYYVAAIYAALGDHDRAFEWLDRAYQRGRATCLDRLIDIDPLIDSRFDSLRSDPRFERLLERSGIPSAR